MKTGDIVNLKPYNEAKDHWGISKAAWEKTLKYNPHIIKNIKLTMTRRFIFHSVTCRRLWLSWLSLAIAEVGKLILITTFLSPVIRLILSFSEIIYILMPYPW